MIISVNWLKKFTSIDLPINELVELIGTRLVEIERVIDLGAKYQDVVVAKVVECHPLEDSDHLNVTWLDDGGVVNDVERDTRGLVQVVCGAPNVREGLLVVWLPPRCVVPDTYGDKEPFVLGARQLRGVMSNGMIASAKELDLFDDHTGILELDKDLPLGSNFAEGYELDDFLLDIENKSLTHRPDTFGIIGFAREVAAIQGKTFETPAWLQDISTPEFTATTIDVPSITIDTSELSNRYQAVVLSGADGSAQSPLQLQTYLSRVGVRPISAVVDITNYLMMLTGQPLHAFDYDKLIAVGGGIERADIHVRAGRAGETLKLLDGRTIQLADSDIVIASGEVAVGLAGAMGGAETEIDASTKNIILESATFNLYNLRTTQMRHGIFSEAITRFTKGQPAELTAPVLTQAIQMMAEYAGAHVATPVIDAYPGRRDIQPIRLHVDMVNAVLGSKFMAADIVDTLENVGFRVEASETSSDLDVTPPYWRADIHIPEDLIEEMGRLNGFDTIEPRLPARDFTAVSPSHFDELRARIRKLLVRAGANEVLTYSFVHGDLLEKSGQAVEQSYRITNSISPDLQYYRQTLTPSLLSLMHPNIKNGYDAFAVFELNKAHNKSEGVDDDGVPRELNLMALVLARQKDTGGAAFYEVKRYIDYLGSHLGLSFRYEAITDTPDNSLVAPFEPQRSARVIETASGRHIGIVGEFKRAVKGNFKLPAYSAGFELDTDALYEAQQLSQPDYTPLSRYPSAERDICFQVSQRIEYAQIIESVETSLRSTGFTYQVSPVDIYQMVGEAYKNITVRLKITSYDKTLTGNEVSRAVEQVVSFVMSETSAKVI